MANIANVKVKAGNVLELSGSSVSISGSGGLNLHTADGGISANAGSGSITLSSSVGPITLSAAQIELTGSTALKGDLNVSGTITAHTLNIVETTVSSSVIEREGSTRFGNDSGDNHQFSGSLLLSGSMTIAAGSGQFNGSGAGLTDIPNGALSNNAITINGASTSLGGSITTVGASNGLAESSPVSGKISLSVQLSGSDSGLVVGANGVLLSGSVARKDRDADWGSNSVSASWFVGNVSGSTVSASLGISGSSGQFGSLTLGSALSLSDGGTGTDLSAASEGASGFVMARSGSSLQPFELTSSNGTVSVVPDGANKKISLTVNVGAAGGVTLDTVQTITGQKTFTGGLIVDDSTLTLRDDAPLVASGSVDVLGTTTLNGATIVGKSLDLDGILTVAATATGSVSNDHSVVMAADNSEVVLQAAATGRVLIIKKVDAGTSAKGVEIQASGAETIDGEGTYGLYGPYQSVTLIGSGSSWFVL